MTQTPGEAAADFQYMNNGAQPDPTMVLPVDGNYEINLSTADLYHSGGYWLMGTQMMNGVFPTDSIADVAFDTLEELIWCVSRMGQLTAFYSVPMERYISTVIPLLPNPNVDETIAPYGELKQVFPSPRLTEHAVYVLASNALHAYTKFGRPFACSTDKLMMDLECITVTGPTGAAPGIGLSWRNTSDTDFARIFLGGLQPNLLELDAVERWGEVVRTIDVGLGGSVVLRPFSSGLCAGNTNGKVMVIDSRTSSGIVREIDAHTGEISDITVVPHGYTLVTCGWSRIGESGLRVDRLLKVYDLRSGRAQIPLSASLDPCFIRFFPGCTDRLLAASQTGAFQTIQWGNRIFSPNDLGQMWLTYDRLVALDISQNGDFTLFGTEGGQLQLYSRDINFCQFNVSPLPTDFASPLAESLWPANTIPGGLPPAYPLMLMDNPANSLYGTNLMAFGKTAAEATGLQLLAASLHQPAATSSDNLNTQELVELVERRKAEAAVEAVMMAYKPVEYGDYRFSCSSVPFMANPPPLDDGVQDPKVTFNSSGCPLEVMSSSDWPEDLCRPHPQGMLPVDPELVVSANRKRTVRKPSHWGPVWHPYPAEVEAEDENANTDNSDQYRLGRFVSVKKSAETTKT
ncbi:unnamed protein product [Calicophoron daubneyi]|uniref:PAN2-PAN3 deadenylation complex catalytic subunit PAN2 N-terminal domain-containing protein n=1 Tax=Calicophoron daubneyi TaxID=300641 RepID=A0AAV2TCK0_CALDB